MGSIPVAGAKTHKHSQTRVLVCFFVKKGIEGGAVVNDTTVWCQSRGVTEPAGERNPLRRAKKAK